MLRERKEKEETRVNRRDWLKRAGLAAGGLALGGAGLRGQAVKPAPSSARYPELKYINLAGNENPFGPSRAVTMAIVREARNSSRYPFREEEILKDRLAEVEGVPRDHILLGNGCDEILSLAGAVYGEAGRNMVATRPTYLQLMRYAERQGCQIKWVDHTQTMRHDLEAMEEAVDGQTSLVYVCNPDTPSGTMRGAARVEAFCRRVCERGPVFLDEVYLDLVDDFRTQTQVDLVKEGLPVVIGRSFSKMHGLAGLRVGYAVSRPDIVEKLARRKMSSMNYLGVIAAIASVQDEAFHRQSIRFIKEERERFCSLLDELALPYTPSHGNFVFHWTGIPVREFQAMMKERNFLVGRPFPPYNEWCRISIGTREEMQKYDVAMREVFARRAALS